MRGWGVLVLCGLTVMVSHSTAAQEGGSSAATCSYRDCALGIAPTWNGLLVVRGAAGTPVANLDFFLPRDIAPVLRGEEPGATGADSAFAHARRAVALRRVAASLTDLGALATLVAAVRMAGRSGASPTDQVVGGVGLAALVVSVPLQFAADGALSRAVWWHNARFAR